MKLAYRASLVFSLAVHGLVGAVAITYFTSRSVETPRVDVPITLEIAVLEPDTEPRPLPAAPVDSLPAPSATLAQKQELSAPSPPAAALSTASSFETLSAVAPAPSAPDESRAETLPSTSNLAAALPVFAPVDFGPLPIGPAGDLPREIAAPSSSTSVAGSIAYRLNPSPTYPAAARREKLQGLVLLRVEVSEEGFALKVEIEESSGHRLLDTAALDAVRRWRFEPARVAGQAIKGRAQVPIRFKLES